MVKSQQVDGIAVINSGNLLECEFGIVRCSHSLNDQQRGMFHTFPSVPFSPSNTLTTSPPSHTFMLSKICSRYVHSCLTGLWHCPDFWEFSQPYSKSLLFDTKCGGGASAEATKAKHDPTVLNASTSWFGMAGINRSCVWICEALLFSKQLLVIHFTVLKYICIVHRGQCASKGSTIGGKCHLNKNTKKFVQQKIYSYA